MSIVEEVEFHTSEHFADFKDKAHTMAVFGLGVDVLRREVMIEAVEEASTADTDN